jgi:RNA-directed DNA polymerase
MMNDPEESDPAVVAKNLTNKAGSPAAEQGEPRAGTKGKADQHSTCRAQDRESVSQGLARIRHAARHRTKETFTALFHHINPEAIDRSVPFVTTSSGSGRRRFGGEASAIAWCGNE